MQRGFPKSSLDFDSDSNLSDLNINLYWNGSYYSGYVPLFNGSFYSDSFSSNDGYTNFNIKDSFTNYRNI